MEKAMRLDLYGFATKFVHWIQSNFKVSHVLIAAATIAVALAVAYVGGAVSPLSLVSSLVVLTLLLFAALVKAFQRGHPVRSANPDFKGQGADTTTRLSVSFRIVDSIESAVICGQLNAALFRRSLWHGTDKSKTERNRLHWEKCPGCLMLVANPLKGRAGSLPERDWIGFTHILPLTYDGWFLYISGKLKDNDFSKDFVAGHGENIGGFLLFTVGFDFDYMRGCYGEMWTQVYNDIEVVRRAAINHLCELVQVGKWNNLERLPLLEQVPSDRKMLRLAESLGLKKYGDLKTADGCNLYLGNARPLIEKAISTN